MLHMDIYRLLDEGYDLENSFRNYHVPGVDYLCLSRSENLTWKIYFIDPDVVKLNPEGFLVAPHDHAYPFHTWVLGGSVQHVRFYEDEAGDPNWRKHLYKRRPDASGADLRPRAWVGLRARIENHHSGARYFVDVGQVHTLIPGDEEPLVLLLKQEANVILGGTRSYFKETSRSIATEGGLYSPMSDNRANEILSWVLQVNTIGLPAHWANEIPMTESEIQRIQALRVVGCRCKLPLLGEAQTGPRCRLCNTVTNRPDLCEFFPRPLEYTT